MVEASRGRTMTLSPSPLHASATSAKPSAHATRTRHDLSETAFPNTPCFEAASRISILSCGRTFLHSAAVHLSAFTRTESCSSPSSFWYSGSRSSLVWPSPTALAKSESCSAAARRTW